jgi:hypothetical protein
MLNSNIDLLSGFTTEQFSEFRSLVMNIILATDMVRHGEYVAKLNAYTGCSTTLEIYTIHYAPYTLYPAPCTLHPAPLRYTLYSAPYTLHLLPMVV